MSPRPRGRRRHPGTARRRSGPAGKGAGPCASTSRSAHLPGSRLPEPVLGADRAGAVARRGPQQRLAVEPALAEHVRQPLQIAGQPQLGEEVLAVGQGDPVGAEADPAARGHDVADPADPDASRRFEPGSQDATAPLSANTLSSSSVTQTKCSSTVRGPSTPRSASRRTAGLPYRCRLNIISERVSSACVISEVPWSSAARWQRRYSSSEQAGVQSGAVTIRIRSSPAVPVSRQRLERRHHVVDRPGVPHRRRADLGGEIRRAAGPGTSRRPGGRRCSGRG